MILLTDEKGKNIIVSVSLPGRDIYARAWMMQVGRVPLYLLDTSIQSLAADETPHKTQEMAEAQKQASTRIGPTSGTPVNTMISGGGLIARASCSPR